MATVDTFENLKKLQDILVEKYKLEKQIEETPKKLGNQEELLARMKEEFIKKNSEYDAVKEKVSKLKFELDEAVRVRENGEKGMDNITTHREYEALEKQILEATDKENEIRKELQKEEKTLVEIKESSNDQKKEIDDLEQELISSNESIKNELEGYEAELKELKEKEDEITPGLDQEILFKFQRIIQRNNEGIVAVKNGVCMGCHMILPAQFANTVHAGDDILFCPYCSRILFYEESDLEDGENYFTFNDAGSLADINDYSDDEGYEEEEEEERETPLYGDETSDYYGDEEDEESDDELDESNEDSDDDEDDDSSDEE